MQRTRSFRFAILLCSLALSLPSAVAQVVIATVPVGNSPFGVAVNSATNKTYVANYSDNTVTVIDGATNTTKTVNVGAYPCGVAVNPSTNKIYVSNSCGNDPNCNSMGTVTVIDGATNNTTMVNAGAYPYALAVNSMTNKIYVENDCGNDLSCSSNGTVTVIDGATNNTATVNVGDFPEDVEVNSASNQIYVVNNCGNDNSCSSAGTVTVIDGVSNNTATVNVGAYPYFAAVDSVTNQIYVANNCGNDLTCSSAGTVTVIDGATKNTTTVNAGAYPYALAVNSMTNKIYVPNYCGNDLSCASAGTVTVINGATNNTVPVAVGDGPQTLAVNATTDRIYVPNFTDGTVSVIAGDTALQFVAVPPCRLVDTRLQNGGSGPIQGGTSRSFTPPQLGGCNIPTTAAAYSLNVTAVPEGPLGYLTVWPAGQQQPLVSTLNSVDGRVKANAAIVPAGTNGAVSVYVSNTSNVVLDIDGYFAPASSSTLAFYPLTPCRVADTRDPKQTAGLGPPYLSGGVERDFPILGATTCNIPNTAQAYSLNFTAVPHEPLGYLTTWAAGQPRPDVSTLNSITGVVVANAAVVQAEPGTGKIAVFPTNDTDLVIDINGYFAAPGQGGLSLYTVPPCRVLDTRLVGGLFVGTLPVNVVGSVCAPSNTAQAYVLNATVVPAGPLGYLTLWPDGISQPLVSTLNSLDGAVTSNMAIVPTNNGSIDAFATNSTQLILDISSYFGP